VTSFTHDTVPTQYAEGGGIRFAYRRFGMPGRPPLLFFQHFMGTMDDHDPALSDAFADDREVILFNNAGVASSSGIVPDTIEAMARDAITFTDALGLTTVDLVGHSMGGLVAQEVALARPDLVRRLVLVGTGRVAARASARSRRGSRSSSPGSTSGRKTCGCRSCSRRQ
jgi:pimeloyl-ACP methyl ester carboxylesterase